ncbi:platelet-activating factor acetylhydrolase IB subunit beta homolog [Planococcus citri]|uniref:platelet-activating factor acetylhydrolase IB subunit beta homolog n=1 Tax=Planococcus citri TaxID=170843 RepID=UPI0031F7784B
MFVCDCVFVLSLFISYLFETELILSCMKLFLINFCYFVKDLNYIQSIEVASVRRNQVLSIYSTIIFLIMNKCIIPTIPVDNDGDGRWNSQHNCQLAETKEKEPDVVFIGDTIIQDLQQRPIWNEIFEPLHSLNLGIAFDCIENVLYRIQDGILDHIKPKIVVVHVGTYNINDKAVDIADGITKIVQEIQFKLPNAYIIVLEILPRGQFPNPLREKNDIVNELLRQKLASFSKVEVIGAGKTLCQNDGTISHHDMLDYLTLTEAGYRKVFEPIYELILQLMGENEIDKNILND